MRGRRLCARAFSRTWRERYESELLALLAEEDRAPWAQCLDLLGAGARQRAGALRGAGLLRGVRSLRGATRRRTVGVVTSAALAAMAIATVEVVPGALAPATLGPAATRRSAPIATVTVGRAGTPAGATPRSAGAAAVVVLVERSRGHGRQRVTRAQRGAVRTVRLPIGGPASGRATGSILSHGASS